MEQVQAKLATADASYAAMNYVDAMHAVISAYQLAQQLLESVNLNLMYTGSMSVTTPASTSSAAGEPNALYIAVGVVVGLVVGLTIAMVVLKKPSNESKTKVYGRPYYSMLLPSTRVVSESDASAAATPLCKVLRIFGGRVSYAVL